MRLRYAARSDVGLLREGNEDSAYAGSRLLAVADGMGGHAAGEVASAIAISAVAPLDGREPGANLLGVLRGALDEANEALREMVSRDSSLDGMGTTLTALLWADGRFGVAHVGDSRAYLLRGGELTQITHDHTFVQDLVDEGRISAEEASVHPQRAMITRALDGRSDIEPDVSVREALLGDRYLLCTDGLSGVVSPETMRESLSTGTPEQAAGTLVELALRGGGPDNVTVIVADVVGDDEEPSGEVWVGGAAASSDPAQPPPDTAAARAARTVRQARSEADGQPAERQRRRRGLRRLAVGAAVLVLVVAAGVGGAWAWVAQQWYVGDTGSAPTATVALFHGVEGSVAGVSLHRVHDRTRLPVAALPPYEQDRVRSGITVSGVRAGQQTLRRLLAAACPSPSPSPTPAPVGAASPTPIASAGAASVPAPPPYCTGTP